MIDDDLVIEYSDIDYDAINDQIVEENWGEYVRYCNSVGQRPTRQGCLEWSDD